MLLSQFSAIPDNFNFGELCELKPIPEIIYMTKEKGGI